MLKFGKTIKRIIIITLSVILLIFTVLLTAPILFKNQIIEIAKTELNKMLLAKVEFKELTLSFIRNFPNAYIGLDGLEVTGVGNFEGELLVAFDRFSVTVDIMSVIKMDNIEVKSILLDRARLNGHILEDGHANWDIIKPGKKETGEETIEKETEKAVTDEEPSPFVFKVGLNKFEIRNMSAVFNDEKNKMSAEIESLNYTLHGDMKKENVDLQMNLAINGIDFFLNEVRLANKVNVGFVSEVMADLKNMAFQIKHNRFNLNEIALKFDGSVDIKGSDIIADVTFASEKTDFKSLMSLVPVVYMNDFKDLTTTGSLAINGDIKGTYNETTMPSANAALSVDNAAFSYPALPKSVNNINISVKAHYDGEVFDRTTADVNKFSFEIAGNPFHAEAHVKTPESDLQVAAKFAGRIDFDSIADIVPLNDIKLNGLLECDLAVAGKLSTLEKEQYEDFQAEGHLKLSKFYFESPMVPKPVNITGMHLNFTPRFVELANLDVITGETDVSLNGSLENFIPFVLKNDTVRGKLALKSNTIDLNEFMGGEPKEKTAEAPPKEEAGQMSVIEVPKNIDFAMNVNIGKILFDKLTITNTTGALSVKDGKVVMQNLNLNLLEGSMALNGEYNTQNIKEPIVDLGLNIKQIDIPSALTSFSMLGNILPESQNYLGKVSGSLTLNSPLDQHLSPVLDRIESKGRLQTHNLEIRNSKIFGSVAGILHNDRLRNPSVGDLDIGFEIRNGRLYIEEPIMFNLQSAKIAIKGDQGLDMSLNYKIDAATPVSTIGSGAANILSSIPGGAGVNEVQLTGLIKGSVKNPDISLSVADMANTIAGAVREQVTQTVSEEVNKQIDNIMAEARKQAENIRSASKTAADKVRREANSSADKLISNAGSNPVQKKLAETTAGGIRREGETNAKKLEQEGETQAQAAIAAAERKANDLRR